MSIRNYLIDNKLTIDYADKDFSIERDLPVGRDIRAGRNAIITGNVNIGGIIQNTNLEERLTQLQTNIDSIQFSQVADGNLISAEINQLKNDVADLKSALEMLWASVNPQE